METLTSAKRAYRYATFLALVVTLGPFFYGFEGMVLNGAISAVGTEFELGDLAKGVAGATGIIGGIIGALFAGRLSDKIGRRTAFYLLARSFCSKQSSVRSARGLAGTSSFSCAASWVA